MNLDELKTLYASGKRTRFLMFWGHTAKRGDAVGAWCLSQWFGAAFEIDGVRYATTEHFMMAEKARLFGDEETLEEILRASSPGAAKALGRKVRGFDNDRWCASRYEIVVRGNVGKFSQNSELGAFLTGTKNRVLVEASPPDRVWGIGLAADDERAENPLLWRGLNLLGFALMDVRDTLDHQDLCSAL
tara:strand:- start:47674 stop:48237 length:564 start_codon:yes stop_codon:yes gene_type:complete